METFKDLFQEIKDRIRNPFISSFALAWLFFNWRITVALIFYNDEMLQRSGYDTFNNLINARQDNCKMLLFPIVSALAYVFLFPYGRNFINEFLATRKMENDNKILENSKKSAVKLERYIDLLKELEQQQNLVGDIYSKQKLELEKLTALQNQVANEQQANNILRDQLNGANKSAQQFRRLVTTPSILGGSWNFIDNNNADRYPVKWVISSDDIYLPDGTELKIRDFLHNPTNGLVHFSLYAEEREPAGPSSFFIEEVYKNSYEMKYDESVTVFKDARQSIELRKIA